MKVIKSEFVDFLKKTYLNGMIEKFVIEEDGSVDATVSNSLSVFGKSSFPGFGKRVGISAPDTLLKIVNALESSDNTINIELQGVDMLLATKNGKYTYRLADADVIESVREYEERFRGLHAGLKNKILFNMEMLSSIKKSMSILCKGDTDVITFFANDNQLQVIASDDATKCTSATNIGNVEGTFKLDFKAKDMSELLNVIGTAGATFCIEEGKPLCIELADKSFLYMVANVMNTKVA